MSNGWVFLKYLNLAKILLLNLGRIEEVFEILVYLSLAGFEVGVNFLLSWKDTYCLKVISLSLVVNLFQPDLYIAVINF